MYNPLETKQEDLFEDDEIIYRYNLDNTVEVVSPFTTNLIKPIETEKMQCIYPHSNKEQESFLDSIKPSWKVREEAEENKRKTRIKEINQEYIDAHAPGAKLDNEKPMLDLVLGDFANALLEVGKVGTMGAKKYSEHGWLSVDRAETRYLSAGLRHYFQYKEGIELDGESGLPHLSHAAWNFLAVLELYLRNHK